MSESDKSGKQELTAEDKKRISSQLDVIWSDYNNYYETGVTKALMLAEYATLHERSAAQARIAELEKMLEQFTYYGLIHTVNGVVPVDYDSHEDLIKKAKLIFQKQP